MFCRLEEEKGIRIRFTTGLVPDEFKEEIAEEEAKYGEFLRIPIKVSRTGGQAIPLLVTKRKLRDCCQ